MNVESATMQIDRWTARTKYLEYREAVKVRAQRDPLGAGKSEDGQLTKAYGAIARGECVIDVRLALEHAGAGVDAMPKLAVARADWEFVQCYQDGGVTYFDNRSRSYSRHEDVRLKRLVHARIPGTSNSTQGRAQVPFIPPKHRPAGHLSAYRILFEAVWKRVPPVDPMLLRHVAGNFYVVCAHWDLSPLEQGVLRGRL